MVVDEQLSSIMWVFMVDLGIFLIELATFFLVRKRRGDALFNHKADKAHEIKVNFDAEDLQSCLGSEREYWEPSFDRKERGTALSSIAVGACEVCDDDKRF